MAIAKSQFNTILRGIFKEGNRISLLSQMPNADETGYKQIGTTGVTTYTIQSGDFSVTSGEVTSISNMQFELCETDGGLGTAVGFAVFGGSGELLYYGEFNKAMTIGYNTVPIIKRYNAGKNEGIKITMTSEDVNA